MQNQINTDFEKNLSRVQNLLKPWCSAIEKFGNRVLASVEEQL